jgi:hypothetical protein
LIMEAGMNRLARYFSILMLLFSFPFTIPAFVMAAELPDLQPVQIAVTNLYSGVNNTVSVVIANNGNIAAEGFDVKLEAAESGGSYQEVEIRSGNFISFHDDAYYWPLTVNFNWVPSYSGSYTLRVTVDPAGGVAESDEDNNIREQNVQVKDFVPVTVQVRIEGKTSTLWNGPVTFSSSNILDKAGKTYEVDHPTALGALAAAADEGGFEFVVSSAYGPLTYVESIGGDDSQGSHGWLYLNNWLSPSVAAVDYTLADNDDVLWYYGGWAAKPLKISTDKSSLSENQTFTATVREFDGTDWSGVQGAEVKADFNSYVTDANGEASDISLPAGSYSLYSTKGTNDSYIRSNILEIVVNPSAQPDYPLDADDVHISEALAYLKQAQQPDGSVGDFVPSCWVVMAVAAAGQDPHSWKAGGDSIVTYLSKNSAANVNLDTATDLERLILSIVAAGENPGSFGGKDYLEALLALYDGTQMGDTTLLNDDIWAVMALQPTGADPEIISHLRDYILLNQNSDGGWSWAAGGESDADNTAAAISALVRAGVARKDPVIADALAFLKTKQQNNGGFISEGSANSAVDSWVIRALRDAGQNPADAGWAIGEDTPITHLLSLQDSDGAFKWTSSTRSRPEWMTAYAVTALLGAEWPEDTAPPEISSLKPASDSKTSSTSPLIKAGYSDALSGIDESAVKMWLDGAEIENAEISAASISCTARGLALGDHTVKVSVSDKKNNQAEKSWTFRVIKSSGGGGGGGGGLVTPTPTPSPVQTPSPSPSVTPEQVSPDQAATPETPSLKDNQTVQLKENDPGQRVEIGQTSQVDLSLNPESQAASNVRPIQPPEIQVERNLAGEKPLNWTLISIIGAGLILAALVIGIALSRKKK